MSSCYFYLQWKFTLSDSRALLSNLNLLKFFGPLSLRVEENSRATLILIHLSVTLVRSHQTCSNFS